MSMSKRFLAAYRFLRWKVRWTGIPTSLRIFLMAQRVKSLPAVQETWVWSLGWEDPLEKEIATLTSILTWKIPWRGESCRVQSIRGKESDTTEQLTFERVTGRKAKGLQTEKIGCKCQTFLSVLSGRRKQNKDIFFSFSTNLEGGFS